MNCINMIDIERCLFLSLSYNVLNCILGFFSDHMIVMNSSALFFEIKTTNRQKYFLPFFIRNPRTSCMPLTLSTLYYYSYHYTKHKLYSISSLPRTIYLTIWSRNSQSLSCILFLAGTWRRSALLV